MFLPRPMIALVFTSSSSCLVKYSNSSKTFSLITTCKRYRQISMEGNSFPSMDKKLVWNCPFPSWIQVQQLPLLMQIVLQLTGLTEYKGNHQSQHFCSDNSTTWLFIVLIWKVKYHWWNNPTLLLPLNSSRSKSKWRARAPTVKSDRSRKGLFATNVVLLGSSWCCSFSLLSAPEKKIHYFFAHYKLYTNWI